MPSKLVINFPNMRDKYKKKDTRKFSLAVSSVRETTRKSRTIDPSSHSLSRSLFLALFVRGAFSRDQRATPSDTKYYHECRLLTLILFLRTL